MKRIIYKVLRCIRNSMKKIFRPIRKVYWMTSIQNYKHSEGATAVDSRIDYRYINPFEQIELEYEVLASNTTEDKGVLASFIIPAYNSAKYIGKCLDSIINQTTKYEYEIIIINDGSTDSTSNVISNYTRYSKVRYYEQENRGIAYTRNKGVKLARGKYIGFIDNDDIVDELYVEELLERAELSEADVVKCGHVMHLKDGNVLKFCEKDASFGTDFKEHVTEYNGYIWGGISRKDMWNDICFPYGFWYEDMMTRFLLYLRTKHFEYIGMCLYHKNEHDHNASRIIWSKDNMKCLDQVYLVLEMLKKCKDLDVEFSTPILRSILREYGKLLYERTKGRYYKDAYMSASKIVREWIGEISYSKEKISHDEKLLLDALLVGDFEYYNKVIKYLLV